LKGAPIGLVFCSLVLISCTGGWTSYQFGEDDFPEPSLAATYLTGAATLEITQAGTSRSVPLTHVGPGSQLLADLGANVNWRNDQGMVLNLWGYNIGGSGIPLVDDGTAADVTLHSIQDNTWWTASAFGPSGNRCIVDVTEMSATAIIGSATCRGLRWVDGASGVPIGEPPYIEGQEPFDATITFEARP
jgi:hypothetical protein